jgi:hypothetical protein
LHSKHKKILDIDWLVEFFSIYFSKQKKEAKRFKYKNVKRQS